MARFLIDVNLPRLLSSWAGDEFVYVLDIDRRWTDRQIWDFAEAQRLTIVSKDADFSDRAVVSKSGPTVVHLRVGNMLFDELDALISEVWPEVLDSLQTARLIRIYHDRIELVT